jgi:putative ATP-grasp target RiPP
LTSPLLSAPVPPLHIDRWSADPNPEQREQLAMTHPTPTIPFGSRVEREPHMVALESGSLRYDPDRQLNVLADGTLWCESAMAPTCTNTNWDSKNDDTADPYRLV